MVKKYVNTAIIYSIMAMVFGVFYREFTKFSGFVGKTNLSVMHAHYFMLGVFFFLFLAILEKLFAFSAQKRTKGALLAYHIGLNIAGAAFFVRGLTQIVMPVMSNGLNASISGVAGIGHTILGVSMIIILLNIKKSVKE